MTLSKITAASYMCKFRIFRKVINQNHIRYRFLLICSKILYATTANCIILLSICLPHLSTYSSISIFMLHWVQWGPQIIQFCLFKVDSCQCKTSLKLKKNYFSLIGQNLSIVTYNLNHPVFFTLFIQQFLSEYHQSFLNIRKIHQQKSPILVPNQTFIKIQRFKQFYGINSNKHWKTL